MSEENLVRQCAPTLAGIKTGTIFPAPFSSLAELTAEIRELNRILVPKGLRLLPLRYQDHTALLYLYRPAELRVDLNYLGYISKSRIMTAYREQLVKISQ